MAWWHRESPETSKTSRHQDAFFMTSGPPGHVGPAIINKRTVNFCKQTWGTCQRNLVLKPMSGQDGYSRKKSAYAPWFFKKTTLHLSTPRDTRKRRKTLCEVAITLPPIWCVQDSGGRPDGPVGRATCQHRNSSPHLCFNLRLACYKSPER